jgi:hypothetical protein
VGRRRRWQDAERPLEDEAVVWNTVRVLAGADAPPDDAVSAMRRLRRRPRTERV